MGTSSAAFVGVGVCLTIAGFTVVRDQEIRDVRTQFEIASGHRVSALRRELESRVSPIRLAQSVLRGGHRPLDVERLRETLTAFRGDRPFSSLVAWTAGSSASASLDTLPTGNGVLLENLTSGGLRALRETLDRAAAAGKTVAGPALLDWRGRRLAILAAPRRDPVQRAASGAVAVVFDLAELVECSVTYLSPVGIHIDVIEPSTDQTLYTHNTRLRDGGGIDRSLTWQQSIDIADRQWNLRFSGVDQFITSRRDWRRWAFLFAALFIATGTALLFRATLSREDRIRALVKRKTNALTEMNQRLLETGHRLELAQRAASMGVWDYDAAAGRAVATDGLFALYGLTPGPEWVTDEKWLALIHPDDRAGVQEQLRRAVEDTDSYENEFRIVRPDGSVRWLIGKGNVYRDEHGKPVRMVGANLDITKLKVAELALFESQERFRRAFANAAIGLMITDLRGRIIEVNDQCARVSGYPRGQLLGMNLRKLAYPEDLPRYNALLAELVRGRRSSCVFESRVLTGDAEPVWVRLSMTLLVEAGKPSGFIALCENISDRKRAEEQLEYQAFNDALTGLPNRRLFADRLAQSLLLARREGHLVALLYINLDGFTAINDTLGHSAGDQLLKDVAVRLRSSLRATDTLARLGGDEFAVVAGLIREQADAERLATKLLALFSAPFPVRSRELFITASIGIGLFPRHSKDPGQLIQQADVAMYAAKRGGRNRFAVFNPGLGRAVQEKMELEHDLHRALEHAELVLHYQPEFDVRSGCLVRFEALVRWNHPRRGLLPPALFIPIAEETGLMSPSGCGSWKQPARRPASGTRMVTTFRWP